MACPSFLNYIQYLFFFWYNIYSCSHICHIWCTFPWFDVLITPSLIIFPLFWLDRKCIPCYLADSLSWTLLVVNISIPSSNSSKRFPMMFSYYSSRLDSMWVIISTSSIITLIFLNRISNILAQSSCIMGISWHHLTLFLRISCVILSWNILSLDKISCLISPMHVNFFHWITL